MVELLLIFFVFNLIYLFPVFVQTLRNIIVFFLIVSLTGCLVSQLLGLEFYPVFLLLVYLGAIVVNTLFVILTFDIREEYRLRDTVEDWPVLFAVQGVLTILSILLATPVLSVFLKERCDTANLFAGDVADSNFMRLVSQSHTDLNSVAGVMYSSLSEYFLSVGVVLTMALFVAISISRV